MVKQSSSSYHNSVSTSLSAANALLHHDIHLYLPQLDPPFSQNHSLPGMATTPNPRNEFDLMAEASALLLKGTKLPLLL